ncbi:hypothetical protein E2C01_100525 [Portunus trituberculatus]|uniref:Uncharacterized protein n=1 Tax=Portunus trituberculatus TaxID=210409 RepID=A0A5B7KJP6_PORTR|nr:hypothetical protein [Portunus trituberculatus]
MNLLCVEARSRLSQPLPAHPHLPTLTQPHPVPLTSIHTYLLFPDPPSSFPTHLPFSSPSQPSLTLHYLPPSLSQRAPAPTSLSQPFPAPFLSTYRSLVPPNLPLSYLTYLPASPTMPKSLLAPPRLSQPRPA